MKNLGVLFSLVVFVFTLVTGCRKDETLEKGDWGFSFELDKEATDLSTLKVNEERDIVLDLKSDNYNVSSLPLKFKVSSDKKGELYLNNGFYLKDSLLTSKDSLHYMEKGYDIYNRNLFVNSLQKVTLDEYHTLNINNLSDKAFFKYVALENYTHRLNITIVNEKGETFNKNISLEYDGWKKIGKEVFDVKIISDRNKVVYNPEGKTNFKIKIFFNINQHYNEINYDVFFDEGIEISEDGKKWSKSLTIKSFGDKNNPINVSNLEVAEFEARFVNPNSDKISCIVKNTTGFSKKIESDKLNENGTFEASSKFPKLVLPITARDVKFLSFFSIRNLERFPEKWFFIYWQHNLFINFSNLLKGNFQKEIKRRLKINIEGKDDCNLSSNYSQIKSYNFNLENGIVDLDKFLSSDVPIFDENRTFKRIEYRNYRNGRDKGDLEASTRFVRYVSENGLNSHFCETKEFDGLYITRFRLSIIIDNSVVYVAEFRVEDNDVIYKKTFPEDSFNISPYLKKINIISENINYDAYNSLDF